MKYYGLFLFLLSSIAFSKVDSFKEKSKNKSAKILGIDSIQLESKMRVRVVESDNLKSRVFGYIFGIKVRDKVNKETALFFDGMMSLETGSNNEVSSQSEFSPVDTVDLNEGGIMYSPFSFFSTRVGALNQKIFQSDLFITQVAFAGIEETISFRNIYLRAMQAIPSNNQLSKRVGTVDQGTPFLSTVTFGLTWDHDFFFQGELTGFAFKDLSSGTADASRTFGNSIQGTGNASRFAYEFSGQNTMVKMGYRISRHEFGAKGQYTYNDKAPEKRNKAFLVKLYYKFDKFKFGLESFKSESDASPSFYNSKWYGHNNREGMGYFFNYKHETFKFELAYRKANEIDENASQYDQSFFTLFLNKSYFF